MHESLEEAWLLACHRHDLYSGFNTVHGVNHKPETGSPKTSTEHDRGYTYKTQTHQPIKADIN